MLNKNTSSIDKQAKQFTDILDNDTTINNDSGISDLSPDEQSKLYAESLINKMEGNSNTDRISQVYGRPAPIDSEFERFGIIDENRDRKALAKTQPWTEQAGSMLGRIVGSELVGGTIEGLGSIYQIFEDVISEATGGDADFTNPLIELGEGIKKNVDYELPIYRENPNKSFDVNDFGWWAENGVSVGSTLGLLIPGMVVGKSAIKIANFARTLRGLGKLSEGSARLVGAIGTAVGMRNGENLQSSLQITNQIRNEFLDNYNNNPQAFKNYLQSEQGKEVAQELYNEGRSITVDNMADFIAAKAGWRDYALNAPNVVFDFIQVAPLFKVGRAFSRTGLNKASSKVLNAHKLSMGEKIAENTFKNKLRETTKNLFTHENMLIEAGSEGVEELINAIAESDGTYYGKYLMNKEKDKPFTTRLAYYLSNPQTYEQAFWGAMGGLIFSGATRAKSYLTGTQRKYEDFKQANIEARKVNIENINRQIDLINDKHIHPVSKQKLETKKDIEDAYKDVLFSTISTMTINEAKGGTVDLLEDFVKSDKFKEITDNLKERGVNVSTNDLVETVRKTEKYYNKYNYNFKETKINDAVKQMVINELVSDELRTNTINKEREKLNNKINNVLADEEHTKTFTENPNLRQELDDFIQHTAATEIEKDINELTSDFKGNKRFHLPSIIDTLISPRKKESVKSKEYFNKHNISDNVLADMVQSEILKIEEDSRKELIKNKQDEEYVKEVQKETNDAVKETREAQSKVIKENINKATIDNIDDIIKEIKDNSILAKEDKKELHNKAKSKKDVLIKEKGSTNIKTYNKFKKRINRTKTEKGLTNINNEITNSELSEEDKSTLIKLIDDKISTTKNNISTFEKNNKNTVILPIGTSGSGKSTWIKSLPDNSYIVVEPDLIREELTGNKSDKSKDKEVYKLAYNRIKKALKTGKPVIFDTTNLKEERRQELYNALKDIKDIKFKYKLMPLNAELAKQRIKQNIKNGKNRANVPDKTIDRHSKSYKNLINYLPFEKITPFDNNSKELLNTLQTSNNKTDTQEPTNKPKSTRKQYVSKQTSDINKEVERINNLFKTVYDNINPKIRTILDDYFYKGNIINGKISIRGFINNALHNKVFSVNDLVKIYSKHLTQQELSELYKIIENLISKNTLSKNEEHQLVKALIRIAVSFSTTGEITLNKVNLPIPHSNSKYTIEKNDKAVIGNDNIENNQSFEQSNNEHGEVNLYTFISRQLKSNTNNVDTKTFEDKVTKVTRTLITKIKDYKLGRRTSQLYGGSVYKGQSVNIKFMMFKYKDPSKDTESKLNKIGLSLNSTNLTDEQITEVLNLLQLVLVDENGDYLNLGIPAAAGVSQTINLNNEYIDLLEEIINSDDNNDEIHLANLKLMYDTISSLYPGAHNTSFDSVARNTTNVYELLTEFKEWNNKLINDNSNTINIYNAVRQQLKSGVSIKDMYIKSNIKNIISSWVNSVHNVKNNVTEIFGDISNKIYVRSIDGNTYQLLNGQLRIADINEENIPEGKQVHIEYTNSMTGKPMYVPIYENNLEPDDVNIVIENMINALTLAKSTITNSSVLYEGIKKYIDTISNITIIRAPSNKSNSQTLKYNINHNNNSIDLFEYNVEVEGTIVNTVLRINPKGDIQIIKYDNTTGTEIALSNLGNISDNKTLKNLASILKQDLSKLRYGISINDDLSSIDIEKMFKVVKHAIDNGKYYTDVEPVRDSNNNIITLLNVTSDDTGKGTSNTVFQLDSNNLQDNAGNNIDTHFKSMFKEDDETELEKTKQHKQEEINKNKQIEQEWYNNLEKKVSAQLNLGGISDAQLTEILNNAEDKSVYDVLKEIYGNNNTFIIIIDKLKDLSFKYDNRINSIAAYNKKQGVRFGKQFKSLIDSNPRLLVAIMLHEGIHHIIRNNDNIEAIEKDLQVILDKVEQSNINYSQFGITKAEWNNFINGNSSQELLTYLLTDTRFVQLLNSIESDTEKDNTKLTLLDNLIKLLNKAISLITGNTLLNDVNNVLIKYNLFTIDNINNKLIEVDNNINNESKNQNNTINQLEFDFENNKVKKGNKITDDNNDTIDENKPDNKDVANDISEQNNLNLFGDDFNVDDFDDFAILKTNDEDIINEIAPSLNYISTLNIKDYYPNKDNVKCN